MTELERIANEIQKLQLTVEMIARSMMNADQERDYDQQLEMFDDIFRGEETP